MDKLNKLMKDLKELHRLSQVYYENKQWSLLEKVINKIEIWNGMAKLNLETQNLEVPTDA